VLNGRVHYNKLENCPELRIEVRPTALGLGLGLGVGIWVGIRVRVLDL